VSILTSKNKLVTKMHKFVINKSMSKNTKIYTLKAKNENSFFDPFKNKSLKYQKDAINSIANVVIPPIFLDCLKMQGHYYHLTFSFNFHK